MTARWSPRETPYPHARRDHFSETFKSAQHGTVEVADPYHYLEDACDNSAETKAFVQSQADYTEAFLKKHCEPVRSKFRDSLRKTQNYPRFSVPSLKEDGYYYFSYNPGLLSQAIIYRVKKGEEEQQDLEGGAGGSLFFDTNLLSTDGTVALSSTAFSPDGKYFAYAISKSGSDWSSIFVRETSSPHKADQKPGSDEGRMSDEVKDVKFSGITWSPDSKGFLYNRCPYNSKEGGLQGTETDGTYDAKLFYHRLGTKQSEDLLIAKNDEPKSTWLWSSSFSQDDRYLYIYISKDTGRSTLLWVVDYAKEGLHDNLPFQKLVNEWGNDYSIIGNDGSKHYLTTNKDAPRDKVVLVDVDEPEKGFSDLVPEDEAVLKDAHLTGNNLILLYSRDVRDELLLFDLETGKRKDQIGKGMVGVISSITGKRKHGEFWFYFGDFTNPGQAFRYRFDQSGGVKLSLVRPLDSIESYRHCECAQYRSTTVSGIDASDYVSEQVFYSSKDGTKIPMFIVSRKGAKRDGSAPAILYGYGGFAISIEPFFSPAMMTFIRHFDGVLAVANLRGGGEYGESWHLAGCFDKKQNVFDDFQYAAKYLKEQHIAGKVIISGGSNGGLLVAACVNQAPDLFAAGVADVGAIFRSLLQVQLMWEGVLDLLRFDRFTIGRAWTADYGFPDKPEGFDYLYKYSPVHNVDSSKTYPPVMLLTGDHDDRVSPLHSFKHAATLQHTLPNNPHPLLLRIDLKSGHGAGKSTEKRIQEASDRWSFVSYACGLDWREDELAPNRSQHL